MAAVTTFASVSSSVAASAARSVSRLVAIAASAALAVGVGAPGAQARTYRPTGGECAAGQLCLWAEEGFGGKRRTYELSEVDIESCVALPHGVSAAAFANRTGRPVTTYQSAECAETGEFDTYPGGGTWVPRSPYAVRAFKVWER